jgi:hypothetical protein
MERDRCQNEIQNFRCLSNCELRGPSIDDDVVDNGRYVIEFNFSESFRRVRKA